MDALLFLIPVAGCGLMMGACMWLMSRGMRGSGEDQPREDTAGEVAQLREEVARLRAQQDRDTTPRADA